MYSIQDLSVKLSVSEKTVRRYIKNLGIKEVGKDGHKLVFDDKALSQLRDAIDTKHRKHESVIDAGMANIKKYDTSPADSVKIQELLEHIDAIGRTLASDEYLTSVANRVTDMLNHREDVQQVINLLTNAINRASLLDEQHDDLVNEIQHLNEKVDGLYDKLVHNIRSFNYQKMAKINADELESRGFGGVNHP
ncbi:hypothetical protein [Limosilactobacillus reuteri]|uniref:hypothetical protein n=1 Tax=Limosilactobacillus reuteri TaxID=1598 RepID=UPI00129A9323|nr:hypothetical protein [Limosilactobacillus reuteri]MRG63280.1 hypothetical protein [Limosilactobacillus reuteri]